MTTVSIVVCTYNGARFLRPQLESLANQTYPHLEILVSDDRSTDNTVEIAQEFARRDNRFRVHINETNLGYNRNFETAFHRASGDLIAVCDQDDIWKREKIARMVSLLSEEKALLAYCQSVRFNSTPPDVHRYTVRRLFRGNDTRQVMYFNTVAGHNMVFRKELLQYVPRFPEGVFYDWWLLISAAVYGSVAATDEVLTFHRLHTENITLGRGDEKKQTRKKADERLRTIHHIAQMPGLPPEHAAFARSLEQALATLQQKRFSFPLFTFLLRHADTLFFFKKKSWLSRAKMAYRLSFAIT